MSPLAVHITSHRGGGQDAGPFPNLPSAPRALVAPVASCLAIFPLNPSHCHLALHQPSQEDAPAGWSRAHPLFLFCTQMLPSRWHLSALAWFSGHSAHWLLFSFHHTAPVSALLLQPDQTAHLHQIDSVFSHLLRSHNTLCLKRPLTPLSPLLCIFRSFLSFKERTQNLAVS